MTTRPPRPASAGRDLALAAGHPLAVQAGLRVGTQGGNAVDAAVAAATALAVILPNACGLGGDTLLLVREPEGRITAYNGVGTAPVGLADPLPSDGAGCAAVPGFVAGLFDAHAASGRLSWSEVLSPAQELATRGVPATRDTADELADSRPRLERGGAFESPWFVRGRSVVLGEVVTQPALAATLTAVAAGGPEAFYRGALATSIAAAVAREGGAMGPGDLASHATVIREPVSVAYRDAAVHVQPPSSQSMLLAMALARLGLEPAAAGDLGVHRAIEAILGAFSHRDRITTPGVEDLLLAAARELPLGERASGATGPRPYNHTTAVCAADPDGLVVSMLISVFDSFGCATYVPEGGFFLNDRLLSFSREPGSPNGPAGGKRPVHTLSPALLERGGRALALATPGADGQVQTLLQVVLALVDEGLDPALVLERGRFRAVAGRLFLEDDLADEHGAALAARGHDTATVAFGDGLFGSVCAAEADPARGVATAWADPRRESWAGAW